ncbi:MAG: transporter substrate-binding domain-containing protein [Magnetovibrio sp.]|nr:transporter substrate-binding domain-containing protein [Magnetovibrio sp.]
MFKFVQILFLLLIVGIVPPKAFATELNNIRVITSTFPPYSYDVDGRAQGIAVEIIRKVFAKLKLSPSIEVYPWARAISTAKATPNSILFSVARTPERESMFEWVGTVIDFDVHIYKKANRMDIEVHEPEDLKRYTFAGLFKDVKTSYLKKLGAFVHEVPDEESTFKMLDLERVDLIASDKNAAKFRVEKLGLDQEGFISVYKIESLSKPLYLVAHRDMDPKIVEQLRDALQSLNP